MIRVAPWLHPILDSLQEKVQQLKASLEQLSNSLDSAYVLARARGQKIQKPAPSEKMCARAQDALQRALLGGTSSASQLLELAEELRARSAPERFPNLARGLGDAVRQLSAVLMSPEFRGHVGDSFPQLADLGSTGTVYSWVHEDPGDMLISVSPTASTAPISATSAITPTIARQKSPGCRVG